MSRCDLGRATAARIKGRRLVDAAAEQFKGPRIRFAGKEALKGEAKPLTLLPIRGRAEQCHRGAEFQIVWRSEDLVSGSVGNPEHRIHRPRQSFRKHGMPDVGLGLVDGADPVEVRSRRSAEQAQLSIIGGVTRKALGDIYAECTVVSSLARSGRRRARQRPSSVFLIGCLRQARSSSRIADAAHWLSLVT